MINSEWLGPDLGLTTGDPDTNNFEGTKLKRN
jgi:hypothetical protein